MNLQQGMATAKFAATYSDDPDTQTGCVIYSSENKLLSVGANRLPPGIQFSLERTTRPLKYVWLEHAERAAIYKTDCLKLHNSTVFINWFPCVDCARALVSVKVAKLVYIIKPERMADPQYGFAQSMEILKAAGIELLDYDKAENAVYEVAKELGKHAGYELSKYPCEMPRPGETWLGMVERLKAVQE